MLKVKYTNETMQILKKHENWGNCVKTKRVCKSNNPGKKKQENLEKQHESKAYAQSANETMQKKTQENLGEMGANKKLCRVRYSFKFSWYKNFVKC